jgi:ribosome modulation factor
MIPPRNLDKPANVQEEGWAAAMAGRSVNACPYTTDALREAWMKGHAAAEEWFANE